LLVPLGTQQRGEASGERPVGGVARQEQHGGTATANISGSRYYEGEETVADAASVGCVRMQREEPMKRVALAWIAIVLVAAPAWTALARTQTPPALPPGVEAARFLPAAPALGDDWIALSTLPPRTLGDAFRDNAAATYGGPGGARAFVLVMLVTVDRVATREAWEAAAARLNYEKLNLEWDFDREAALNDLPPPPGCDEAKRVEGTDVTFGLPTGLTLCAAGSDAIVFAIVSGRLGEREGYRASDALVALVTNRVVQATPISATPAAGEIHDLVATIRPRRTLSGYQETGW